MNYIITVDGGTVIPELIFGLPMVKSLHNAHKQSVPKHLR